MKDMVSLARLKNALAKSNVCIFDFCIQAGISKVVMQRIADEDEPALCQMMATKVSILVEGAWFKRVEMRLLQ